MRFLVSSGPDGEMFDILEISRRPDNWFILSGTEPLRFIKKDADPARLEAFVRRNYVIVEEEA